MSVTITTNSNAALDASQNSNYVISQYDGWSLDRLRRQRNRAHFLLEDPYRFVSVILVERRGTGSAELYCLDSPCYHANGALGEGDIVEIENYTTSGGSGSSLLCIRCPMHRYLVSLEKGEEIFIDDARSDFFSEEGGAEGGGVRKLRAGTCKISVGAPVQKFHPVSLDESTGILSIYIETEESRARKGTARLLRSEAPAANIKTGGMCMQVFDIKSKGFDKL